MKPHPQQPLVFLAMALVGALLPWGVAHAQFMGCPPSSPEWACLPRPEGPQPGQIKLQDGLLQDNNWQQAANLLNQMGNSQGLAMLTQAQNLASNGDAVQSWTALTAIFTTLNGANGQQAQTVAQLAQAINALLTYYQV